MAETEMKYQFRKYCKYLEYVPLMLRNYRKLNRPKIVRFKVSSFLRDQYFLVTAAATAQ